MTTTAYQWAVQWGEQTATMPWLLLGSDTSSHCSVEIGKPCPFMYPFSLWVFSNNTHTWNSTQNLPHWLLKHCNNFVCWLMGGKTLFSMASVCKWTGLQGGSSPLVQCHSSGGMANVADSHWKGADMVGLVSCSAASRISRKNLESGDLFCLWNSLGVFPVCDNSHKPKALLQGNHYTLWLHITMQFNVCALNVSSCPRSLVSSLLFTQTSFQRSIFFLLSPPLTASALALHYLTFFTCCILQMMMTFLIAGCKKYVLRITVSDMVSGCPFLLLFEEGGEVQYPWDWCGCVRADVNSDILCMS